ncbi:MAG: hypothetical protein IJ657_08485 [Acidaminococcaceae bacterium]|nr:hypothetical protein [Acidaminococcaceae bacterium]
MLDFYIITDCMERGLYRKAKHAKRISQRYPEAKLIRFRSPEDIPAAQEFCSKSGISVAVHEWEELLTAGRLSMYAENGVLPPPAETGKTETKQECPKKKESLPLDAAAVIYTDGSYIEHESNKKKRIKEAFGGWAAVIILREFSDAQIMVSGYTKCKCKDYDSYYMELMAVAKALKRLKKYVVNGKTVLYTDCQSLVTDYNTKAAGWEECGWKTPDGSYIKYWKQWRKIRRLSKDAEIQVRWVKGHARNVFNNQCHLTAQAEAMMRKKCRKQALSPENRNEQEGTSVL